VVTLKVGDLVRINQNIPEYVEELGKTVGMLIGEYDPQTDPPLFEVLWPSGETEKLYLDEIEPIA